MATNKKIKFDIEGFNQANEEVKELTDRLGQLHNEFSKAEQGSESFRKVQKEIAKTNLELEQAQKKVESFNKSKLDKVKGVIGGIKTGFAGITSSIAETTNSAGLLEGAFQRMGIENQYLSRAISMMGTQGTKSMGMLRLAFASTGIGLLVIAVGALVAYFTKTTEGSAKLSKAMAYMGGVINLAVNGLASLGKWLVDTVSNFGAVTNRAKAFGKSITEYFEKIAESPKILLDDIITFFKGKFTILTQIWDAVKGGDFKEAGNKVIELYTGVENGIDKATEAAKNFANAIDEAGDKAVRIYELERAYAKTAVALSKQIAALESVVTLNEAIAQSDLKTESQRIAAANKVYESKKAIIGKQAEMLSNDLKILELQNSQVAGGVKSADMLKREQELKNQIASKTAEAQVLELARDEQIYTAKKEAADRIKDTLERTYEDNKYALELQLEEAQTQEGKLAILQAIKDEQIKYNEEARKAYDKLEDTSDKASALLSLTTELKGAEREYNAAVKATNDEFAKRKDDAVDKTQLAEIEQVKLQALQAGFDKQYGAQREHLKKAELLEEKYLDDWYQKELTTAGKLPEELTQLHLDYANKKTKIDQDYAGQSKAIDDKIAEDKATHIERLIDTYHNAYSTVAASISNISQMMTDAAVSALDVRMTELDAFLSAAQENLSGIEAQLDESRSNIDSLENDLLTAKGDARERIIRQLEQERKKETELAMQRRQEDDRIKKAEQEKIRLEGEKEKAIQKQTQTQQKLAAIQAGMVAVESTLAGIEAAKAISKAAGKGKVGWDNIAILLAMTAATVGSLATIKSASKGFAEGGYTGDGGKYQEAGVVHKGEYVIPQWMVKQNKSLISTLEAQRTRGYAEGGMVASAIVEKADPNAGLVARLDAMNAMLLSNLNKPVDVNIQEVMAVSNRVADIKETALK